MAAAAVLLVKPVPPQAPPAPVPLCVTPEPRVRPLAVKLGATIVGLRGDVPKSPSVLTSQPTSVPVNALLPPMTVKLPVLTAVPLVLVTLMKPLKPFIGTIAVIWVLESTRNEA